MSELTSTVFFLFLIMDPLGNLPIFISILQHFERKRRYFIIFREMLLALLIMFLFLFSGKSILSFLNLRIEIVSISGGIILFLIAIKMLFPPIQENNEDSLPKVIEEPFLVPLAVPLISGPSLLSSLMILLYKYKIRMLFLSLSILIAWFFSLVILMCSNFFLKIFGRRGSIVLERLMGLILVMIAIQMFLDGTRNYLFSIK